MKYVIFDFNGTVLDDLQVGIDSINDTIRAYLKRGPVDRQEYTHIFGFPVRDYYERVGFDFSKQDWDEVAQYWVNCYNSRRGEYRIFDGVLELLDENHAKGYQNILLSATKLSMLESQLEELGIRGRFDEVLGIDNIYATSKVPLIRDFMKDKKKEDCIFIGDTLHDLDVAESAGIECVLVANGHQAKEILETRCSRVYDDIREVRL